jgi:hypothetical protein
MDSLPPSLELVELLKGGWAGGRAAWVVPCLLDYLRMMRWDPVSRRSRHCSTALDVLLAMHAALARVDAEPVSCTSRALAWLTSVRGPGDVAHGVDGS